MKALLVAALALSSTPLLFGGGGDEGVDILPNLYGGSGAGGASGDLPSSGGPILKPAVGYIAVHGSAPTIDANGIATATGLLATPHVRSDLFVGTPGHEPGRWTTSLDLTTKGPRKLQYGESRQRAGGGLAGAATPSWLNFNGRFEIEDLKADDGETLKLAARQLKPCTLGVTIGKRGTHAGAIGASFREIDATTTESWPAGAIDLESFRDEAVAELAGTGVDVAVVLYVATATGVEEAWAAFNVDDPRHLFDVEIKLR